MKKLKKCRGVPFDALYVFITLKSAFLHIRHAYGCFASARGYAHTVCVGPRVCAYRNEICVSVPSYRDTSCVGNKGVGISNPQLEVWEPRGELRTRDASIDALSPSDYIYHLPKNNRE